eukprot:TRINITY_DN10237_c0_g2_i1.p1 TRINITY_DN10237_c0_g2~~TRINITY_DN10237_c0_g2_i1.p1  ORF type:complete len:268 (-),score=13.28 TRINITY_DN10237_c0_g2_i1:68-871(-)
MINIIGCTYSLHVQKVGKADGWCVPSLQRSSQVDKKYSCALLVEEFWPFWKLWEMQQKESKFCCNNIQVEGMVLLTGENMSGKSTVMRVLATVVLLGSAGFMVPARKAIIPHFQSVVFLKYFGDDPSSQISEFIQECNNLKMIEQHSQGASFVCYDEFVRGTQAPQGAAIMVSTISQLVGQNCWGLFSTHNTDLVVRGLKQYYQNKIEQHVEFFQTYIEITKDGTKNYGLKEGVCQYSSPLKLVRESSLGYDSFQEIQALYDYFNNN